MEIFLRFYLNQKIQIEMISFVLLVHGLISHCQMRVVELDEVDRPGHKKPVSLAAPSPSPPKAGCEKRTKSRSGLVLPVLV
jgi:hypothetical protein